MIESFMKKRPKSLYAVYVEPGQIEVLHAKRHWRAWEIESAVRFKVHEGESVFDTLQHLNLKPAVKKGTALILFLPSAFYSTYREHYPLSMKDHLEETITFDWQENIFYEQERSIHFFGPHLTINSHISVPIFSLLRETYDKFYQAMNGDLFESFNAVPSALPSEAFLSSLVSGREDEPLELVARILDDSNLEIHRFYHGAFLDSVVIRKTFQSLRSFLENLRCLRDTSVDSCLMPHVHLICTEAECVEQPRYGEEWIEEGFPIELHKLDGCLVTDWVKHLLHQDTVQTFETEVILKPWKVPRVAYPIMAAIMIFTAYAFYQVHASDQLVETSIQLKKQINRLDAEWKPVEELQSRISSFQESQKNLSAFQGEGYPLMELINLLTQVTPEDTYLNYLSLRRKELILRGESKSAIKFLSVLSKVDGLNNVKFTSPVTRNPVSNQERFDVQVVLDMPKLCTIFENSPDGNAESCNLPPFRAAGAGGGDTSDSAEEDSGADSQGAIIYPNVPEQ